MNPSRLRRACALAFNLLALLCILQNLWESGVPVVRYAWVPAAAGALYVIVRGAKAFRLFLESRDSDAACLIFLAAASFLSLSFARGPGGELVNVGLWGRVLGSVARVLRFHHMFGSWWFIGLCSLLGASLAAKVISKRAWRPARAGLTSARVGLLLVLLAGVVWKSAGARGWMDLRDEEWDNVVLDADVPDRFELPFNVRLHLAGASVRVVLIDGGRVLAQGELPLSHGGWGIYSRERSRYRATLWVIRDPGWPLAAVGLVLAAAGLSFDAAVSGRKRWA